jgi:hypothetical protein
MKMPKIVSRKIRWDALAGVDGFNLYYTPNTTGVPFTYDDPHVNVGIPPLDADGKHVLFLNSIAELAALPEGSYDLGVTGFDSAGNEGDFAEIENVPLDLVAPATVTGLEVVDA